MKKQLDFFVRALADGKEVCAKVMSAEEVHQMYYAYHLRGIHLDMHIWTARKKNVPWKCRYYGIQTIDDEPRRCEIRLMYGRVLSVWYAPDC